MADSKTWAKRVAAWRARGKSAKDFAREGYAASTLWRHARRGTGVVRVVRAAETQPRKLSIHVGGPCIEVAQTSIRRFCER
jgi:hypothetical protein